jgi:hypothetical protein
MEINFYTNDDINPLLYAGRALSQLDQLLSIWSRARVIYSRLFKYTQQRTADFIENNIEPRIS